MSRHKKEAAAHLWCSEVFLLLNFCVSYGMLCAIRKSRIVLLPIWSSCLINETFFLLFPLHIYYLFIFNYDPRSFGGTRAPRYLAGFFSSSYLPLFSYLQKRVIAERRKIDRYVCVIVMCMCECPFGPLPTALATKHKPFKLMRADCLIFGAL